MQLFKVNPRSIYTVAKKEFADNVRNKWVIALIIIFIILTLATSYLAGVGSSTLLGGMEETVVSLLTITTVLIPIIAIMLGYSTISGECESGSLGIVLAYPIRRAEVLLGKIFGLGSVLIVSIILGFGVAGILIALSGGAEAWASYLAFIGLEVLVGFLYLCAAIMFSSITTRRVTSLAAGVVLFFWGMIYGIIIISIFIATGGNFNDLMTGTITFPDWLWASVFLSPMDMNQMAVMLAFNITAAFGINMEFPSFMTLGTIILAQLIWIFTSLILAFYFFKKRDI